MSTISDEALPDLALDGPPAFDEVASAGRTALYRLYDPAEDLLYIGISDDPIGRMRDHDRKQPWWPEVARKTAVWYPYREQADRAETIAIGLEQPKYNKAKRYVRLPEQAFPESTPPPVRKMRPKAPAPVARQAASSPAPAPVPTRRPARYHPDVHHVWDAGLPPEWPADLWCISWYYQEGAAWCFEDCMRLNNGGSSPWEPLHFLRRRARARGEGEDPYISWWQPDSKGTWLAGFAPAGPDADLDEEIDWEQQRRFLFALLRAGRCTSVQAGSRAWASGIPGEQEARVVNAILASLTYGPTDAAAATACLEARYRRPGLERNGWRWRDAERITR